MATTPSRAGEKARKVHSLLASYYNVDDGSENPSPTNSRCTEFDWRRGMCVAASYLGAGSDPRFASPCAG